MAKAKSEPASESKTYQQMLDEVDGIVRSVGGGPLDLDEVVTRVERGYKLIKEMRSRLDTTKARVEKLRTEFEQDDVPSVAGNTSPPAKDDEEDDTPF